MSKLLKKILSFIYNHFLGFWLLFTVVLIYPILFLDQMLIQERSQNTVTKAASDISNKMDGLIQDIFQEAYALPVNGPAIHYCQPDIFSNLEHITLNNPNISGILISDKNNKPLCSTLPKAPKLLSSPTKNRTLTGPYTLSIFDQPVYLLQQKMGNYFIGILVPSSVLQNTLKTQAEKASVVVLYDEAKDSTLLKIEYNDHTGKWLLSSVFLDNPHIRHPERSEGPPTTSKILARCECQKIPRCARDDVRCCPCIVGLDQLQSISGISVIVNNAFPDHLKYSEIVVTCIFLFISYLIYQLFKSIMNQRFSLTNLMKSALKNKEFFPVYQPIHNCSTQSFTGVEVLLRWQDDKQLIMPDLFIAEAETTGLIVPITLQILDIVVNEMQNLLNHSNSFHLGINISAYHFRDPHFFKNVIQLFKEYSIAPSQIIFEITERDLLDINNPLIINKMTDLRNSGFSLAVDDYGTGHASISYLQKFPFNYLKIDKIFVQAIGTQAITESLNDAIIQMAKNLNLTLIAEGIETEEQATYLTQNGVQFLQGWYFSKDLDIEQLTSLLKGDKL